nr:N-acetyltransferase family protein [Streptococcus catagoni]
MTLEIRLASLDDASELLAIYAPYVEKTAVTFDYDLPDLEVFKKHMAHILEFYPYLLVQEEGQILAYAYAKAFHERAAYAWTCEATIYVKEEARGQGIGQLLYRELENCLKKMGILSITACIAQSTEQTPYLNDASQIFHEKLGYQLVAPFTRSAINLINGFMSYGWKR